jgi:hypothetical protein
MINFNFQWVVIEKRFLFEVTHKITGLSISCWVDSEGAVLLFNKVLEELKRSTNNPESLPEPIVLAKVDEHLHVVRPPTADGQDPSA